MKGNKNIVFFFFFLVLFVFVFVLSAAVSRGQRTTAAVNVGIVADVGTTFSDMSLFCINMSLSDFYSSRPGFQTRLVVNVGDSKDDVIGAAAAALELIKNKEVKAILGPWTSMQAHFVIEIGRKSQVPIISFSATSPLLTSIRSPYFFRATYEDSSQVEAISEIIKLFGWREVVPVYVDNTFGEGIIPHLTDALQGINVRIPYRTVISPNATDDEIFRELYKMMTLPTRVFIVHMYPSLASRVFVKAKEIGLMKKGYTWILTTGVADVLSTLNRKVVRMMRGVLGVRTYIPRSKELERFRARWSKRFPITDLNIYGLWAYDAATALAMAVEEAGTPNSGFSKTTDARQNTSELKALGVSRYGPKLLQTLSRVQFKGLSGDFRFINGHLQPSVFEIVNVIGSGGKRVGFWTKEGGIVKKLEQKPGSTSSFLGPITWPGDTTFVPKGWEIPTNGRKLQIVVPKRTGFTELVKVKRDPITNAPEVTGFCIDFFEAVTRAMPYDVSYDLIPFETPDGKSAGDYNEMVRQVYLKKFDAAVGDTTILANRSLYVDFTLPYTKSGVGLIVPMKDRVKRSSVIFLTPLTWKLWVTSLSSFFAIGFVVWVLEHRVNPDFRGPANYQASTILWFTFSTMVFAPRERVFTFWSRVVVITWYFVVLVLTQSYTASLASVLMSQQLHPTETSMKNLLGKGEPVAYPQASFVYGKLKESGFSESNLKPFGSAEECEGLLRAGPRNGGVSAAFMEIPYMRLFLGQYCHKYKMVEQPFNVDGFGFVFPIGSPLVADVSRAILKVAESSKAAELERAWFKNKDESCPDPVTDPDPHPSESFRRLGLDSFWFLFAGAAFVCLVALSKFFVCFLMENQEILKQKDSRLRNLWNRFHKRDENSYIGGVEKCQCSSTLTWSRKPAENRRQIFPEIV
ncbi:PREDICTED: glutamate receptor 2.1-like [Tarenaya hassleriana]|uniref:glutamate receptor 2.1-like n=1 Tax=Tarenaya hassleriana TaxID=28532 RepID=UPI00053C7C1E|nr:PREDICTED: glutamate receptor 2.1-like [Tarenaya hassleriana]